VGDLVVLCDNHCAMHRRDPFDPNSVRRCIAPDLRGDSDSDPEETERPRLQKSDANVHFLTDPTIYSWRRRGQL
jgi:hypothetical protein